MNKPQQTEYGVYLGDKLIITYDSESKAECAANFATSETGTVHTYRKIDPTQHTRK